MIARTLGKLSVKKGKGVNDLTLKGAQNREIFIIA
ncbi:MAG: hypothetical protein ACI84K_001332 [Pseudohongiellaceae bacterium]|jgi:hypothetical protein